MKSFAFVTLPVPIELKLCIGLLLNGRLQDWDHGNSSAFEGIHFPCFSLLHWFIRHHRYHGPDFNSSVFTAEVVSLG